jgi:hypothetical protein
MIESPSQDKDFQFNELPASVERLRHSLAFNTQAGHACDRQRVGRVLALLNQYWTDAALRTIR